MPLKSSLILKTRVFLKMKTRDVTYKNLYIQTVFPAFTKPVVVLNKYVLTFVKHSVH